MTKPKPPDGYGSRTTLTPRRTYEIPGGPKARSLGRTEIRVLAEIERGGPEDRAGNRGR